MDGCLLDSLVKEELRSTLYEIMAEIDPFTEKVYPADLESRHGVRRKDRLGENVEAAARQVIDKTMHVLGVQELDVYVGEGYTLAIENTQPPTLILGQDFLSETTPLIYFLTAYSLFYISRNHIMAQKLFPAQYKDYVARLVEAFADTGKQPSAEKRSDQS